MRARLRPRHVVPLAVLVLAGGCKKSEEEVPRALPMPAGVRLGPAQKIAGSPLVVKLPKGWSQERLDGADAPEPEDAPPGLIDLAETVELWRATTSSPTGRAEPFILITADRRLPKGTSLPQYLVALRKEQEKSAKAKIIHLEAERIERDGRPGYALRDSMEVPVASGGSTPMHQVARIYIDDTQGYTITAMMLDDDRPHLDKQIRAILESIRFTTPPPKEEAMP